MNKSIAIKGYMEHSIVNLSKAIKDNNPELTWAVLANMYSTLPSYIEEAKKLKANQTNKTRPEVRVLKQGKKAL